MSGAWTKDRKVWTPHQAQRPTHSPRVGRHRRQSWAILEEWEEGHSGSWLIASPTPCNGNGILNRTKLGRQNKAIPLNKCSTLKQPE